MVGRILRFTSTNIFTNLAAEERLFNRSSGRSLLFYVNSECAVLGRTQNPFNEVDVAYAAKNAIPIARRRSGGGTVVHDEGNLNFCFIRPKDEHNPLSGAKLVAGVLKDEFGINAVVNNRADILVEGKKVSGAAYRISRDRSYHHGTLLINSDLSRLRRLLKSPLKHGLTALGTASLPSSVTNLNNHYSGDLPVDAVVEAITERFSRSNANVSPLTPANVEKTFGGLQSERGEICSQAWVYGRTPRYSFNCTICNTPISFEVGKGAIVSGVSVPRVDEERVTEQDDIGSFLMQCCEGKSFDGKLLANAVREEKSHIIDSNLKAKVALAIEETIPVQYWREDVELPNHAYN